jgi:aspartyl-tRNA(Asn)/glutamyl-tRNA(Gln) amidotransferase subunit A
MASSLDQIGPFAQDVESMALAMRVIEGPDVKDATSAELSDTSIPELGGVSLQGVRVGVPKEFFVEGMDGEVKAAVEAAIEKLKEAGAEIKEISLPHTEYALATYYIIMPCEVSSNLGRYDGVRYGLSEKGESLFDSYDQTREAGFGAEVKRRIMLGSYALSAGYYDQYYRKALKVRTLIKKDFDEAFKEVDLIVGPTSPTTAWKLGEKSADPLTMYLSDIYTISANLAGIPGLSVPCGFAEGLPVGLQLLARPFEEKMLYHAGMAYQALTDWHTQKPE